MEKKRNIGEQVEKGERLKGEGTVYRVCLNVRKMTRGQSVEKAPHIHRRPFRKKSRIRKDAKVRRGDGRKEEVYNGRAARLGGSSTLLLLFALCC